MAVTKAEILDAIAGMTVLELSELIKEMEEKFGVSAAAAAVAVAAPAAAAAAASKSRPNSPSCCWLPARRRSKSSRSCVLPPAWASRKPRIWSMAPRRPSRKRISKADAEALKKQLEDAGAKVEVK